MYLIDQEQEDSPVKLHGKKMTKFLSHKFNRLIPGRSIDIEQKMIEEFVRKSKEMDITIKDAAID